MACSTQAGEHFPVPQRSEELITLHGCVLRRRLRIDGVYIEPSASFRQDVLGFQ